MCVFLVEVLILFNNSFVFLACGEFIMNTISFFNVGFQFTCYGSDAAHDMTCACAVGESARAVGENEGTKAHITWRC